jgi:RNA polymerase sigma-70 factor (ECF subfamily)
MADDFLTTRWSIVRAAGADDAAREGALAWLCEAYWVPLYAYLRRKGNSEEDARDLVQSFFVHLLEKDALVGLSPEAGKFRAFMLASLKNFAANERARAAAEKRRATNAAFTVSLDDAEEIYRREASSELNAEELFEKRWALAVVVSATARLRAEFAQAGRTEVFEVLQQYLVGESDASYAETAERLGMNEGAVKTAIHRLRKRLGKVLRDEVAETVADPSQVDAELRYLLGVLG